MQKRIYLAVYVIGSIFLLSSQKTYAQKDDEPDGIAYSFSMKAGPVYNTDYGLSIVSKGPDDDEVVQIKKNGQLGWETKLPPGDAYSLAKWQDAVLCFYTPKGTNSDKVDDLHAVVIDPRNGQIKKDVAVFHDEGLFGTDIRTDKDPSGNFRRLLVRTTGLKRKTSRFVSGDGTILQRQCAELKIVNLDEQLKPLVTRIDGESIGRLFMDFNSDRSGNLFITTTREGQIFTEKYSPAGKLLDKLTADYNFRKETPFASSGRIISQFDTANGNAVLLSIWYTNKDKEAAMSTYHFDFSNHVVSKAEDFILDKDFSKQLEATDPKLRKSKNLKEISGLNPSQLITTGNNFILISSNDFSYMSKYSFRYGAAAVIVTIFDKKLKLVRHVVVDKYFESFLPMGNTVSANVINGKLWLVVSELYKVAAFTDGIYTVDLSTGELVKKTLDRNVPKSTLSEPAFTLWFNDGMVLDHVWGMNSVFGKKRKTTYQQVSYR